MLDIKHTEFSGRLVIVGFGSIGQGVLPLLLRHIDLRPDQIVVITAEMRGHEVAEEYGVRFVETALTRENYRAVLDTWLGDGDFLLNVSVDVSSVALIELCRDKGVLYLTIKKPAKAIKTTKTIDIKAGPAPRPGIAPRKAA